MGVVENDGSLSPFSGGWAGRPGLIDRLLYKLPWPSKHLRERGDFRQLGGFRVFRQKSAEVPREVRHSH